MLVRNVLLQGCTAFGRSCTPVEPIHNHMAATFRHAPEALHMQFAHLPYPFSADVNHGASLSQFVPFVMLAGCFEGLRRPESAVPRSWRVLRSPDKQ